MCVEAGDACFVYVRANKNIKYLLSKQNIKKVIFYIFDLSHETIRFGKIIINTYFNKYYNETY